MIDRASRSACVDPRLVESTFERVVRQAGADAKALAAMMGLTPNPTLAAAVKAEFARCGSLLPPGVSAVPPFKRK